MDSGYILEEKPTSLLMSTMWLWKRERGVKADPGALGNWKGTVAIERDQGELQRSGSFFLLEVPLQGLRKGLAMGSSV